MKLILMYDITSEETHFIDMAQLRFVEMWAVMEMDSVIYTEVELSAI